MVFTSNLQIPKGVYFAVRADGHSFHKVGEEFMKPIDPRFVQLMHKVVLGVSDQFNPSCAYTQSDEISFIFIPDEDQFNRRVEKFVSLIASSCSSYFSLASQMQVEFDARIIYLPNWTDVWDYLMNRQEDCFRNCINSHALYSVMIEQGLNTSGATKFLHGYGQEELLEVILDRKVFIWEKVPDTYKYGAMNRKINYTKVGYNPKDNELASVERSQWCMDSAPNFALLGPERLQVFIGLGDYVRCRELKE